jgi:hypothetical protein
MNLNAMEAAKICNTIEIKRAISRTIGDQGFNTKIEGILSI